jgi:uncharacterized protein YkwD
MLRFLFVLCLVVCPVAKAEVIEASDDLSSLGMVEDLGDLHAEINKFRKKRLLPELTLNQGLLCAAALHASDIGPKRHCSNVGTDGSNLTQRLVRCGLVVRGGESEVVACGHADANQAVIGLLSDPRTSVLLLNPLMKEFGADQVNRYWVVVLSP